MRSTKEERIKLTWEILEVVAFIIWLHAIYKDRLETKEPEPEPAQEK